MTGNILCLTPQTTETIIMNGKREREYIRFTVRTTKIAPAKHVKYLGITLDWPLTFGDHIKRVSQKEQHNFGTYNAKYKRPQLL